MYRLGEWGADKRAIVIGLLYFLSAAATIAVTRFGTGVALVWIAHAILLAELTLRSRDRWTAPLLWCGLASFCATWWFGFGLALAGPLVLINLAESVIAASIFHMMRDRDELLDSMKGLGVFVFGAGIAAPAITGVFAALAVYSMGGDYSENWVKWFTGHGTGALVFTPLALLALRGDLVESARRLREDRDLKTPVNLTITAIVITLVFMQDKVPLLFLPILPIMLTVFRAGRFGAAATIALQAVIGGYFTLRGSGPINLIEASSAVQVLMFQGYVAFTVVTVLPASAELSHRKALYTKLKESEARYRLVSECSTDIVMNRDADGIIRYVSPAVFKATGYVPDQVLGRRWSDFMEPEFHAAYDAMHVAAMQEPHRTHILEYRIRCNNGATGWFESHAQGVLDEDGKPAGVVSSIRNISHRKSLEARLHEEATTDMLTGILNRRGFMEALEGLVRRQADGPNPAALAIFDIDYFKQVNDDHGHATGDAVLRRFADAARLAVRQGDLVGRLGGEEFGIVLRDVSAFQARAICERLRQTVEAMAVEATPGVPVRITVSAGITALQCEAGTDALLRRADRALYRAKSAGRNRLELAA